MNCILKRALTAATLCVAVTLGACTSGGYYSAAPVFSRPYTYPSSRTHYSTRAETRSSYSGSYVAPSGTVIYLPYASSDYYRVRPDYYPREIYSTQSYYYRPYQYYRYRPYYKKRYGYRGDSYYRGGRAYRIHRRHFKHRRHATGSDRRLRGADRIGPTPGISGDRRLRPGHRTIGGRRIEGRKNIRSGHHRHRGHSTHGRRRSIGKYHTRPGHRHQSSPAPGHRSGGRGRHR